ncbi:hypothetical protein TruAng_002781 [Truncatella angustata]|nr:hypothetical protein TruAng_002781 [Truncatella angustata]
MINYHLVWLGDSPHTVRIIAASTSRFDLAKGTLRFLVDWQTSTGLLPHAPPTGYTPELARFSFSRGGGAWFHGVEVYSYILADYQILGVLEFIEYVRLSGDVNFATSTWANWKANLEWINSNINSTTGLLNLRSAFLGPASAGSAVNCALVEAVTKMAEGAMRIEENVDAEQYNAMAAALSLAINRELWNEEHRILRHIRHYKTGTGHAARRRSREPPALAWPPGFKRIDFSVGCHFANTNGFILKALLSQGTTASATLALDLIMSLWTPMLSNKTTSTSAF